LSNPHAGNPGNPRLAHFDIEGKSLLEHVPPLYPPFTGVSTGVLPVTVRLYHRTLKMSIFSICSYCEPFDGVLHLSDQFGGLIERSGMPVVPAAPEWCLTLTESEILAIRAGMAEYVRGDRTDAELDASWSVLAEIAHKLRRYDSSSQQQESRMGSNGKVSMDGTTTGS
jgi:hypothetical protein